MTLRVGLTAPWDLDRLEPDERRSRLSAYADAGIDHLFTADHVSFVGGNGLDGIVKLAAWSGIEPRLDLHLGVFLLALRHPMVAARQIATLAEALQQEVEGMRTLAGRPLLPQERGTSVEAHGGGRIVFCTDTPQVPCREKLMEPSGPSEHSQPFAKGLSSGR